MDDQDLDQDIDTDIETSEERPKRRKGPIIFVGFGLIVIGALVAILGFNVFEIRDQYIFPPLRSVPFVGQFIPAGEYIYVDGELVGIPVDTAELEGVIYDLAAQLEAVREELAVAQTLNGQQAQTITVLQVYRDFITNYRENRQQFDEMIAMGDPGAFAEFYEQVEPENAARLFSHIRATREVDREFRRYAATYAEMNTDEAAAVFTLLLTQNPTLLLRIIETFNTARRAEVFNEMEASDVAIITILMEPDTMPEDILPPIQIIDGGATPIPVITMADAAEEDDEEEEEAEEEDDEDEV